jgi:SH3-like domain-containing protein
LRRTQLFLIAASLAGFLTASPAPARASSEAAGKVTGLPVPRYVSLKTDRVNLREGPSKDHRTAWVFQRAGLPVEIVAEFETWRRIRDAEGTEGWVLHSLLSGRRTALITPWEKGATSPVPLYDRAADRAEVVARLQPGVIANVRQCGGTWCRIVVPQPDASDLDGYIRQDRLWGVYPNEKVE